jgi:hypothetical protein
MAVLGGFALVLATPGTRPGERAEPAQHEERTLVGALTCRLGPVHVPDRGAVLSVGTMLWLYHRHVAVTAYDRWRTPSASSRCSYVHALPDGIRGLVFAGLFAAAVVGATLNAMTTIWIGGHSAGARAGR